MTIPILDQPLTNPLTCKLDCSNACTERPSNPSSHVHSSPSEAHRRSISLKTGREPSSSSSRKANRGMTLDMNRIGFKYSTPFYSLWEMFPSAWRNNTMPIQARLDLRSDEMVPVIQIVSKERGLNMESLVVVYFHVQALLASPLTLSPPQRRKHRSRPAAPHKER